jgi:Uncharacterized protein conserved in bacteria (DUF2188)
MAIGDVHVLYRVEIDRWVVKLEGSNVSSLHETKWAAVSAGRERARASMNGAQLLVHARHPTQLDEQVQPGPVPPSGLDFGRTSTRVV